MQIYIQRTDLWNEDLIQYLDLINITDNILVRHTYVILEGIEAKLALNNKLNTDNKSNNESENLRDWCQAKNEDINRLTTLTTTETTTTGATTIGSNKKKKLRVD
ncbi:unnamed protein product [Rotaria sordida]|uniref:Uncharacterized protein n=1 Tax=Rotaria sordida TaxID=392033 RepID=A0A819XCA4_9BILA|nr:unnamed protein product [Rotaria sordida]CAF4138657.1 unnamed protein product [Rotaria sordida]